MYIKVLKLAFIFAGIIMFIIGSVYLGYQVFKPDGGDYIVLAEDAPDIALADDGGSAGAIQRDAPRIIDGTRIMYEYLDTNNELRDSREVSMPYYFMGMDEQDLEDSLIEGWSIKEFDEEMVVLNRVVDLNETNYMLGVHNGYIAVYYNENSQAGDVKETIDKPISALSIEEQNRLIQGIPITGEEQLVKVLEDYGS